MKHFRVFGYLAYVHVNDEHRKKLDDKSEKCIFIGYSEYSKAYRFFNPVSHKVVVSRDAIFDEGGSWKSQKYQTFIFDNGMFEENDSNDQGSVQPSHVSHNHVQPRFDPSSQMGSSSASSSPQHGSYSPLSPGASVNQSIKGKIVLKYHPSSQMLDQNVSIRLTRNQTRSQMLLCKG